MTRLDELRSWAAKQGLTVRSGARSVEIYSYSSEPIIRRVGRTTEDAAFYVINCIKALGVEIE